MLMCLSFPVVVLVADSGFRPATQAKILGALHQKPVKLRAVQDAASRVSGGESPYDAQELLEKVGVVVVCSTVPVTL